MIFSFKGLSMISSIYAASADKPLFIRNDFYCSSARRSPAAQCGLMRVLTSLVCASIVCACSSLLIFVPAHAEEVKNDIIIEKNLFSPERKKWVSETPSGKQSADKLAKKEINDIMLMGTAIRGKERYAVLHAKKDESKGGFKPWMKGDYVQGYLLKEIEEKMVVLQDEADNKEYILYINDEKKERVAEKTAVKIEQPKPVVEDLRGEQPGAKTRARRAARQPANPVDMSSVGASAGDRSMGRNFQRGGGVVSTPSTNIPASSTDIPESIRQPFEGNDTR